MTDHFKVPGARTTREHLKALGADFQHHVPGGSFCRVKLGGETVYVFRFRVDGDARVYELVEKTATWEEADEAIRRLAQEAFLASEEESKRQVLPEARALLEGWGVAHTGGGCMAWEKTYNVVEGRDDNWFTCWITHEASLGEGVDPDAHEWALTVFPSSDYTDDEFWLEEVPLKDAVYFCEHVLELVGHLPPDPEGNRWVQGGDIVQRIMARIFERELRSYLQPGEWEQMVALNALEVRTNICHSHDFVDANVAMHQAFREVFGRDPDTGDEHDAALWSQAWDLADIGRRARP